MAENEYLTLCAVLLYYGITLVSMIKHQGPKARSAALSAQKPRLSSAMQKSLKISS